MKTLIGKRVKSKLLGAFFSYKALLLAVTLLFLFKASIAIGARVVGCECISEIIQDTVLEGNGKKYCFYNKQSSSSSFKIPQNVTLTIKPGATIFLGESNDITCDGNKHPLSKVDIYGALNADGVTFTSLEGQQGPEEWEIIYFHDGSEGVIKNSILEYGGAGASSYAMVHVEGNARVTFNNTTFRFADSGIYASGSFKGYLEVANCLFEKMGGAIFMDGSYDPSNAEITIQNNRFQDLNENYFGGAPEEVMCIANTGKVIFKNNTFSNNHTNTKKVDARFYGKDGNTLVGPDSLTLENNTFTGNNADEHYPVQVFAGTDISGSGNTFNNYAEGYNGVMIYRWDDSNADRNIVWGPLGSKYIVPEKIIISHNATLTLLPGVEIYFHPKASIDMRGKLTAQGTESKPIKFYGKDKNNSGLGFYFNEDANGSVISHVISSNNRAFTIQTPDSGTDVQISISDCNISDTNLEGIIISGRTANKININNCVFHDIENYAIKVNAPATPHINNANIYNCKNGIYVEGTNLSGDRIVSTTIIENSQIHDITDRALEIKGTANINKSTISNSKRGIDITPHGLRQVNVTDSIIKDNTEYGVWIQSQETAPSSYDLSRIHINNCSISGNAYGVFVNYLNPFQPDDIVDAEDNWWGSPSGPSDAGPGTGDKVSNFVDYDPWKHEDPHQPKPGSLQFSSDAYNTGESGGTVTITVTRTGGSDGTVSVNYSTSDGTATAGSDYRAASGVLRWADGDTSPKSFNVTIINDNVQEENETVNLILTAPTGGASLGSPSRATLTIVDDDTRDHDNDGVNDDVEDAAPNNGDGNGDGTPDSQQANVTSLPSATGKGYITVEVINPVATSKTVSIIAGCNATNVSTQTEAQNPDEDTQYDYPFGLVSFRITCQQALVRVYFHGTSTLSDYTYRKYGPVPPYNAPSSWYTLPGVKYGIASIGEKQVGYAEFTLSDGQIGDDTPQDNVIDDQGGPGKRLATTATSVPALTAPGLLLIILLLPLTVLYYRKKKSI